MKFEIRLYIMIVALLSHTWLKSQESLITTNHPSKEFISFVTEIDSLGWIADTIRLKKVAAYNELKKNDFKLYGNKPFYPISFKEARINSLLFKKKFSTKDEFNYDLFQDALCIWAYYYRGLQKGDMISDGVIEQWEFKNSNLASQALKMMQKSGTEIYFNTQPYFFRIENKLYVFQTRAMKFSLDDQIHIYEMFAKNYGR